MVFIYLDMFVGAQPADEMVVDAGGQLFLLVRDTDDNKLWKTMEVIDDAQVFELVNLVKDDDRLLAVALLRALNESVMTGQLPVNVDRRAEVVKDLIECPRIEYGPASSWRR